MEKIEKLRRELIEHESNPFRPFFEITERARQDVRLNPPERKRIRIGKFGWGLLLLLTAGMSYGGYKYFSYRKTLQLRQAVEKQEISNMAARYNASSAWREKLEQLNQPGINKVREILARDGHPLLLSVCVPQIAEIGKGNQVRFAEFGSPDPEIDFVLECSAEQIAKLRQSGADDGTEVAVIAAIASVEETGSDDSPFLARGRCLDFVVVNY